MDGQKGPVLAPTVKLLLVPIGWISHISKTQFREPGWLDGLMDGLVEVVVYCTGSGCVGRGKILL